MWCEKEPAFAMQRLTKFNKLGYVAVIVIFFIEMTCQRKDLGWKMCHKYVE